jgi:acyl-CoA dehydrogenase
MATLGGRLKRRETITGRLADALAWLYLGSAVVKRLHDADASQRAAAGGDSDGERAIAQWALDHALAEIESALAGVLRNLPARPVAWLLAPLVFPLGRRERGPDDRQGSLAARALLDDERAREALTAGIFLPPGDESGLGRLEAALRDARPALEVEARLRRAVAEDRLDPAPGDQLVHQAVVAGLLQPEEALALSTAREAREEAIRVDAFDPKEFAELRH